MYETWIFYWISKIIYGYIYAHIFLRYTYIYMIQMLKLKYLTMENQMINPFDKIVLIENVINKLHNRLFIL